MGVQVAVRGRVMRIFICCRVGVMKCCSNPCWLVSTGALWGGTVHGVGYSSHQQRRKRQCSEVDRSAKNIPSPCTRGPVVWAVSSQAVNNETANLFFSCLFFFGWDCRRCWCFQTTDQRVRVQSAHSPAFTRMPSNNKCTPLYPPSLPPFFFFLSICITSEWCSLVCFGFGLRFAMAFFYLFSSSFSKLVRFLSYCALVYAVYVYCTALDEY